MVLFRESSYKKIVKYLEKKGFTVKQGGNHAKATNEDDVLIVIPRHKHVTSGVVKSITKKLVNECGLDEEEVEKAFK